VHGVFIGQSADVEHEAQVLLTHACVMHEAAVHGSDPVCTQ
jgi:hypothetical protein